MAPEDPCCQISSYEKRVFAKIQGRMSSLAAAGQRLCYQQSQVLFYEGHDPCGLHLLERGSILLCSHRPLVGEICQSVSSSSQPLGLFHLIAGTPYCATATAATEVEVIFIPKAVVVQLLAEPDKGRQASYF